MLSLLEELFLLSIDDSTGTVLSSAGKALGFGLAGAVLAELALQNKVCVNDKGRLELIDDTETGDKLLDKVLREMQASEKPRKLTYWVNTLSARPKKFRQQLEESLAAKGIIAEEDGYGEAGYATSADSQPVFPSKYEIKNRLRAGILAEEEIDLRSLALLSLARASKLLNLIFTKDERRAARRYIREKILREALANPVAQSIEEIETAVSASLADANS